MNSNAKLASDLKQGEIWRTTVKAVTLQACFITIILVACFALLPICYEKAFAQNSEASYAQQLDSFEPTMSKPAWVDTDNNGIADTLDQEITTRIANGTSDAYVNVTVLLKTAPTIQEADDFATCGGYLTTSAWTKAVYGFGGLTTYDGVLTFAAKCPNLLLIEKDAVGNATVAYAAQQVGARTYVWNDVGLQGDPSTAIAFLDTGVDGSHVDFQPGYGNLDFSKKIIGWRDQISSTTSPIDDNGHGSHIAGLAAGDGFFSVDASGNAIATWGADLGRIPSSGTYIISGLPINKAGVITLNVKWGHTGTGSTLNGIVLVYGDKTVNPASWTQLASVNTPSQNTFYSLNYTVTTPPTAGFDMYHVGLTLSSGSSTSDLYVTFTVSWPYTPPSDGFQAWTGIAPQSKIVGVKIMNSLGSGTANQLISGLNWLITNRITYHVTVASLSLGFTSDQPSVDASVVNLVNSGVSVVVAAGNDGSGGNRIYTCGSIDEVATVAAMNQFDCITDYSSQGGPSRARGGTTVKPDITAPGGSLDGLPLFSVDTNYNDAESKFAETQSNDSSPLQGTSMATPIVSGCAQLLVQAMGGFANWNYTKTQALQPKMILCMTATETYPNLREENTSESSPTLDRGGKDIHEGYGRVNLDVAVDAVMKSYGVGNTITDTLGVPPTAADTSALGQHLAWARNVRLLSGTTYSFSLAVPTGADYDIYLYNSTGTTYGEPSIVARSINATTGGTEQFTVKAPYTGSYYIVVKRATETTGSGTFTLTSSGPNAVTVTLSTPGLQSAANVVHYTQNGFPKDGSIVAGTFSDTVDPSTTVTIDNPISVSSTQRHVTSDPTTFTVQTSTLYTINYVTQFYITVESTHGAPTPSQWTNKGSNLTISVTSPTEVVQSDYQWICTGFTVDNGPQLAITSYTFSNVQIAHTITANWQEQFYLTVNSAHGSSSGAGWYNSGTTATAALSSDTISANPGARYVFAGWSGDATGSSPSESDPVIMDGPKTATANWKAQYYLNTSANFGTVSPGSGWYDAGSSVTIIPTAPNVASGERYVWNNWAGTGANSYSGNNTQTTVTMLNPINETASWSHQYTLTVQSKYGSPTPTTGWLDAGTLVNATVDTPLPGSIISQFNCSGWSGTGSVPLSGRTNSVRFTLTQPSTIKWNWDTQYLLLPLAVVIGVPAVLVIAVIFIALKRNKKIKWSVAKPQPSPAASESSFSPKAV
jgi:uncharacterized repeat protein (TIGR02543 family)